MGANLGALLKDHNGNVLAGLSGELLQPDRGGEPRGPGADDHDVELHGLALNTLAQGLNSKSGRSGRIRAFAGGTSWGYWLPPS